MERRRSRRYHETYVFTDALVRQIGQRLTVSGTNNDLRTLATLLREYRRFRNEERKNEFAYLNGLGIER